MALSALGTLNGIVSLGNLKMALSALGTLNGIVSLKLMSKDC
jgi:hypothetical protein